MPDTITILTVEDTEYLTKKVRIAHGEDKPSIKQYSLGKYFSWDTQEVSNLEDLSHVLWSLQHEPKSCVIRGVPREGAETTHVYRRTHFREDGTIANPNDSGTFNAHPRQWVMLDVDGMPTKIIGETDVVNNPDDAATRLRALLPPIFQKAACFYKFSTSQGVRREGMLSAHLWFWLDRPISDGQWSTYWKYWNVVFNEEHNQRLVDPTLFNSIQIHYTADPIFEGMEDPLIKRSGVLEGQAEVPISLSHICVDPKAGIEAGMEVIQRHLNRIGDDKDGFHGPIRDAAACWIACFGKPDAIAMRQFKDEVRQWIDEADQSKHDEKAIETYKSDRRLESFLKTAAEKGFGEGISQHDYAELVGQWVYVLSTGTFYNVLNGMHVAPAQFDLKYLHLDKKSMTRRLLSDPSFRQVDVAQLVPGQLEDIVEVDNMQVYNTWEPRTLKPPLTVDAKIWEDHLLYLVDGDLDAYEHLADYLATVIASPGTRIRHAIVLGSEHQGTGKSYIRQVLESICGRDNVTMVGTDQLKDQFNGWVEHTELVVVEELMAQGRLEMANRLKPIISEDHASVRRMRTDAYRVRINCNVIAFTNHNNAMILEAADRRYWVWYSEAKPRERKYYKELFKWTFDNLEQIYGWALDRVNSYSFDPDKPPPVTKSKQEMIEESMHPTEAFVIERAEAKMWPLQHDLISTADLKDALQRNGYAHLTRYGRNKWGQLFRRIGGEPLRDYGIEFKDGSKQRLWAIRDPKKYKKMTDTELANRYQRPGRPEDEFTPTEY